MQLRGGKEAWKGQYDHAVKMWEGVGNTIMMRKGSMGLANMTNDHTVNMREGLGNTTQRRKGSMGKTFLNHPGCTRSMGWWKGGYGGGGRVDAGGGGGWKGGCRGGGMAGGPMKLKNF